MPKHPETEVIRRSRFARAGASPLTTPIYATTTFVFDSAAGVEAYLAGGTDRFLYTRYANPTIRAVEDTIAALEGGERALVTSSGMAATTTALFGLLKAGDEVVCGAAIYGGTARLLIDSLARFGVTTRFVSLEQLATGDGLIGPATRVVWFETPINPSLRCVDIRKVTAICRDRGVTSAIDNTFASPINQQPLALGVDLVMHSATKYLNGHSDVTCGALVGSETIIGTLAEARKLFGGVLEPASAYALGRGLKTLGVRMARHNESAQAVARAFEGDRRLASVSYPGLASHPDHAVAAAQMSGFGGMLCIDVIGGYDAACRAYDRLSVFQRAASLGGVESLCSLPVQTSHHGYSDERLAAAGVTRGMMRLSVGLEHPDDLIADLDQSLG